MEGVDGYEDEMVWRWRACEGTDGRGLKRAAPLNSYDIRRAVVEVIVT